MKKQCLNLSVFTLIILLFFSFSCKRQEKEKAAEENPEEGVVVSEKPQSSSPIEIVRSKRAKEYVSFGKFYKPKNPKNNVILFLDIEGISYEKMHELSLKVVFVVKDNQNYTSSMHEIFGNDENVWLRCVFFSIPKNITRMELVVGDYPPVEFEAESELFESL